MKTKKPPVLSIITIVRDNVDEIGATVESVLAQKSDAVEYVVVDGASTDGTLERLKGYGDGIDILISERDNGIYQALNKGIRLAHGSIVGIAHSGDHLLPGTLNAVIAEHQAHPEAILYGCVKAMRGGRFDSVWGWTHAKLDEKMLPHPACFVPRSVYERYGCYDESFRIAGDYEAFLRYYRQGVEFRFLDIIAQEFDLQGISQVNSSEREVRRIKAKYGIPVQGDLVARAASTFRRSLRQAARGVAICAGAFGPRAK